MPERRQFVGNPTTAEADQFTGLSREMTINMQANAVRVHDGVTKGGHEMARNDFANVSNSVFAKRLTNKEDKSNKVSEIFRTLPADNYPNVKAIEAFCNQYATKDLANLTKDAFSLIAGAAAPKIFDNGDSTMIVFPWNYAIAYGKNYDGGNIQFPYTFTSIPAVFVQGNFVGNKDAGWSVVERITTSSAAVNFRNYENGHYWTKNNQPYTWAAIGSTNYNYFENITTITDLNLGLIRTVSVTAVPADDVGGHYAKKCMCITAQYGAIAVPFSYDSIAPSSAQVSSAYRDTHYNGTDILDSGYFTTNANKGEVYPVSTWCPAKAEDLSDRIAYYRSDGALVRNVNNLSLSLWGWRDGNLSTKVDGYTYVVDQNTGVCTISYNGEPVLKVK